MRNQQQGLGNLDRLRLVLVGDGKRSGRYRFSVAFQAVQTVAACDFSFT